MDIYARAFDFWQTLADDVATLPGGDALVNPHVPLLLSNAAWYPKPGHLAGLADWYAARDIPLALVVPHQRGAELDTMLAEGPLGLEHPFYLRPPHTENTDQDVVVEQLGWTHTRTLGEFLCAHYGVPSYGLGLANTLAKAMQRRPDITAFAAYDADETVGALVTFEAEDALIGMFCAGRGGLEPRLAFEADSRSLTPYILDLDGDKPSNEHSDNPSASPCFERWSITGDVTT
ncbi:MAG: hypothetical protein U5L04_05470 [Trueperaceae bacterium]|nr:hypothetical protein [Trueperaceae bacterium]